jgi:hypothetical protein
MTFQHNKFLFICCILSLTPLVHITFSASIEKVDYDTIDQSNDEVNDEENDIYYDQVLLNLLNLYKNKQEEITPEEKLMFQMALSMLMQMKNKVEEKNGVN